MLSIAHLPEWHDAYVACEGGSIAENAAAKKAAKKAASSPAKRPSILRKFEEILGVKKKGAAKNVVLHSKTPNSAAELGKPKSKLISPAASSLVESSIVAASSLVESSIVAASSFVESPVVAASSHVESPVGAASSLVVSSIAAPSSLSASSTDAMLEAAELLIPEPVAGEIPVFET